MNDNTKKRGRPPVTAEVALSETISFTMTPDDAEQLRLDAKGQHLPVAAFIRSLWRMWQAYKAEREAQ